jgi:uncharacterized protein (TIGR02145 family)
MMSATSAFENVKYYCDGNVVLGTITLSVPNATSPYQYSINNGAWVNFNGPDTLIKDMNVGIYDIEIRNASCSFVFDPITIGRDTVPLVSIGTMHVGVHPTCGLANGSIILYIEGGSGSYQYRIISSSGAGALINYTDSVISPLSAGTYQIEVRDANQDCPLATSAPVTLYNSDSRFRIVVTSTNASTCSSADGTLSIQAFGGRMPYSYTLNGVPVTVTNGTITGLVAGEYEVEATDADNCNTSSGKVRIDANVSNFAIKLLDVIGTPCDASTGLVRFEVTGTPPYYYQLNGRPEVLVTSVSETVELSDLPAGSHWLQVYGDCGQDTLRFSVPSESGLSAMAVVENVSESFNGLVVYGSVELTITGGTPPYSYTINGGNRWYPITNSPHTISGLTEGSYKIVIKDAMDCIYEVNVRIIREIEISKLIDCEAMVDKFAEEDEYNACHYTHAGTSWDAVLVNPNQTLDSVQYFINGILVSSGLNATLDGAVFPIGISEVIVVAFLEDMTDTCEFKVTVERVCPPDVDDNEGNNYTVTKLAGLCWTSNLKATKYSDGTPIEWAKPYASTLYPDTDANAATFGLLYTWYSAVGVPEGSSVTPSVDMYGNIQGICPEGWHIPLQAEWALLSVFAAEDLKSDSLWLEPNNNTNLTGFNSLPAGMYDGSVDRFKDLFGFTAYWSGDLYSDDLHIYYFYVTYYCDIILESIMDKANGLSVRCVLDEYCK